MDTSLSKNQKSGSVVLFFIQIFSTFSFSILYSTLVLYITNGLKLADTYATTVTASFVAFNYALHLMGGFITGRLFSHRFLFATGMILQTIGCYFLSLNYLYLGLAIYLSGAGLNVTCINCMLTQFFKPDDKRRERAFLWNYSAMNLGFFIGFTISGFYEKTANYSNLFLFGAVSNIITFLITVFCWKILKDQNTYFSKLNFKKRKLLRFLGFVLIAALIISLIWLLRYSYFSNMMILIGGGIMFFLVIYFAITQSSKIASKKIWAFLILSVMSIMFWTLYMTVPMGLTLFIEHNVNRHFLGIIVQPQWALNINTIIIIIGGPVMAVLYKRLRQKGFNITIPIQFTLSLFLIGLAFILLAVSINFADANGYISFNWIIISYILQSIGELCISPIGYAMIGQLIPHRLQGIMTGTWMMLTGVAAILSNYFSQMAIGASTKTNPLVTNPYFFKTFNILGFAAIIAGIITLCLVPFLHRLIKEKKPLFQKQPLLKD